MVEGAIDRLRRVRRRDRLFQLAFYHLVRAEILRIGGDPLPDRQAAQAIAKRLRIDLFRCYMDHERDTEKWLFPHQLVGNVEHHAWFVTMSEVPLRRDEFDFLERATLADILSAHGIPFSDTSA